MKIRRSGDEGKELDRQRRYLKSYFERIFVLQRRRLLKKEDIAHLITPGELQMYLFTCLPMDKEIGNEISRSEPCPKRGRFSWDFNRFYYRMWTRLPEKKKEERRRNLENKRQDISQKITEQIQCFQWTKKFRISRMWRLTMWNGEKSAVIELSREELANTKSALDRIRQHIPERTNQNDEQHMISRQR
jgi:hypothetical protein